MDREQLRQFEVQGWHLTRDGSTATARFNWDDPDDPDSGWEILVLHTAGHGCRLTLNSFESGLTERPPAEAHRLQERLAEALRLIDAWRGELPEDPA
ncbi:MAG TPA: hypothetical protein VFU47_04150 [Armatimonadota bacterium]|nr:hypothetical protein [Armatimonadota bacterium]